MIRRLGWLIAAAAVLVVFIDHPLAPPAGLAFAIVAAVMVDRRVIRFVLRLGMVLAMLFSSALAGAVVMWSNDLTAGLEAALAMLCRMLVLVIVTGLLARNIDAEVLVRAGQRLGLERLGLTLGLALNTLPHLSQATRQVALAWRVRRRADASRAPSVLKLPEVLLAHVARVADEAAAAAALRGHGALVQQPVVVAPTTPVVVATGRTGAGKTTVIESLIAQLRQQGRRVTGILQPGRFRDGEKIGFAVRDLLTGDEAELASLVPREEGEHGTRFSFSNEGLALARRALERVRSGDVLVVDELGPLELRGQGHMAAVERALAVPGLAAVVIVVRSQLVPALLAALRVDDAVVIDVTTDHGGEDLLRSIPTRFD